MVIRPRMMSRLALAGLCLLTLGGYSKCVFISTDDNDDDGNDVPVIENDDFTTTLILRDTTGAPSTSFVMGESIRFDLQIQNTSGHVMTLTLPTAQVYDFYVFDFGSRNVRWRWSENMGFAQVVTPLSFNVYETRSYSATWNGVQSSGAQLPAGTYQARGVITATDFQADPLRANPLGSNIVNFTVR
jgi:hypothetical protein